MSVRRFDQLISVLFVAACALSVFAYGRWADHQIRDHEAADTVTLRRLHADFCRSFRVVKANQVFVLQTARRLAANQGDAILAADLSARLAKLNRGTDCVP